MGCIYGVKIFKATYQKMALDVQLLHNQTTSIQCIGKQTNA